LQIVRKNLTDAIGGVFVSKGRVKYFNDQKGWGLIADPKSSRDIYVHYTAIKMDGYKTLREGQEVSYEVFQSDSGPQACNVTPQV
jgi:CspA family cold shock protein